VLNALRTGNSQEFFHLHVRKNTYQNHPLVFPQSVVIPAIRRTVEVISKRGKMKNFTKISIMMYLFALLTVLLTGTSQAAIFKGKITGPANFETFGIYATFNPDAPGVKGTIAVDGSFEIDLSQELQSSYMVYAVDSAMGSYYYPTWYPGLWDKQQGTWIFNGPEDVDTLNFMMSEGGMFSANIFADGGEEFPENTVRTELYTYDPTQFPSVQDRLAEWNLVTAKSYVSPLIPTGMYVIRCFYKKANTDLVPTYSGQVWNVFEAQPFEVVARATTDTVKVGLLQGGSVSGLVKAGADSVFSYLYAFVDMGIYGKYPFAAGMTDPMNKGSFTIHGVPPTNAYVQVLMVLDPLFQDFAPIWYGDTYNSAESPAIPVFAGADSPGININMEKGVKLSGRVTLPNGDPASNYATDIDMLSQNGASMQGFNYNFNQHPDSSGYYTARNVLAPGFYAFSVQPNDVEHIRGYADGTRFAWDTQWNYYASGMSAEQNFQLKEGGMIAGTITDPDGMPIQGVRVDVFAGDIDVDFGGVTGVDGTYYIPRLAPANDYKLVARYQYAELGETPGSYFPAIYSGNVTMWKDASTVEVTAGDTTTVDLMLVRGGRLVVNVKEPQARDGFANKVALTCGILTSTGDPLSHVVSVNNDGLMMDSTTFIYYLPAGEYSTVALPIFLGTGDDVPNYRRTFYGDKLAFDPLTTLTVNKDAETEVDINVATGGKKISGIVKGVDNIAFTGYVLVVDKDNFPMAGLMNMFTGGSDQYEVQGIPDGEYTVLASAQQEGWLVSTWYPNVADPGAGFDVQPSPGNASKVNVAGADVGNIDIMVQHVQNLTSVNDRVGNSLLANNFHLNAIYPNPFNSVTRIGFSMNLPGFVSLKLYDVNGRSVRELVNAPMANGNHTAMLDASSLSAGTYFVRLQVGEFNATKKIVLIK